MKRLQGTTTAALGTPVDAQSLAQYAHVLIDLGTGDGRFVQSIAHAHPTWHVIGVDACRENLRTAARRAPANAQYLVANALALPHVLHRAATQITINFPWGSLLQGLVHDNLGLLAQITAIARPGATLELRLNAGALADAGWELLAGGEQVRRRLAAQGFRVQSPRALDTAALRACPTTWAKRLAFGRDPRALYLRASYRTACFTQV